MAQLLTHYEARTEALYKNVAKGQIDAYGSERRGTFVALFDGDKAIQTEDRTSISVIAI